MQSVLADMALEVEGAVALMMRLCRAFDLAAVDPREAAWARLLNAGQVWINSSFNGRQLGGALYTTFSVMEISQ